MQLDDLPAEVLLRICSWLAPRDAIRCERLSRRVFSLIYENSGVIRKSADVEVIVRFNGSLKLRLICDLSDHSRAREVITVSLAHREINDNFGYPRFEHFTPGLYIRHKKRRFEGHFVRVATNMRLDKAMPTLLKTIGRRFSFIDARVFGLKAANLGELLEQFPQLVHIILHGGKYSPKWLLTALDKTEIRDFVVFRDIPLEDDTEEGFYNSAFMRRLETMKGNQLIARGFNDQALLSMLKLWSLDSAWTTEITRSGLRELIGQWKEGRRERIQFFEMTLPMREGETEEELRKELHDCCSDCTEKAHFVRKPNSPQRLEISAYKHLNNVLWIVVLSTPFVS